MVRVVEPHRFARHLVDERLPYDDTAESAIGFEERWIDIRELALEPRRTRARRCDRGPTFSRGHPLGTERAGGRIGLDVEQAQAAGVRVVHVQSPHEIDHFAAGEMAPELLLLIASDLLVVEVILLCKGQGGPLPLGEGRARTPALELGQQQLVGAGNLGSGADHLGKPETAQIEQVGIRDLPRQYQQPAQGFVDIRLQAENRVPFREQSRPDWHPSHRAEMISGHRAASKTCSSIGISTGRNRYTDSMNAAPLLIEIGRCLHEVHLEAVLIGNAAAALQGAPVTTIDFDFLFRSTSRNLGKLKAIARRLRAMVLRPYYPVSNLYRVVRDEDGLQLDFMATIHGIRSFEGVRDRATPVEIDGVPILVASLADVVRSKRAAGRPRDRAVLEILEKALEEARKPKGQARRRRARK